MSREHVIRFYMLIEEDELMKAAYGGLMEKYKGQEPWSKAMQEEIAMFAKVNGYDISPEDLLELQQARTLADYPTGSFMKWQAGEDISPKL